MFNFNSSKTNLYVKDLMHPSDKRFGIYLGKVEYVNDHLQLGRVVVRVPALHGPPEVSETVNLPWAAPCASFGGGSDYGSFTVPPVGSMVWVMFDCGDINWPVYMGTLPIASTKQRKMLRDSNGKLPSASQSITPSSDKPWITPPTNEAPREALRMVGNNPETYVVFKSPKGASLVIEDRDEVERMRLTDRAGQGLTMYSPITKDANRNNVAQRKVQNANEGNSLTAEQLVGQQGVVTLVDVGGQSIEFYTKRVDAISDSPDTVNNYHGKVRISSRQPETSLATGVTRSGNAETEGKNAVVIEMSGSDNKFTLELQNNGEINTLIHVDSKAGTVSIETPNRITLKSDSIQLDGNVAVEGNLIVNGVQINNNDLIVSGDLLYNAANVAELNGSNNPSV